MSKQLEHFHFIGVCGTAMGSVAAAMRQKGYIVTGSDQNVYPPMSTFLEDQGIQLSEGYAAKNIPNDADVIVVGNAISRGNEEAEAVLDRQLLYLSLPETLKNYLLRGKCNLVVSGTHGKTTTTSMLAWILKSAELDPGWMIGGIPKNLGKGCHFNDSKHVVLEGDEYDTAFFDKRSKFLHYLSSIVVINNIEFDHADIYDSLDQIKLTFTRLLNVVPRNGVAYINGDDANCLEVAEGAPCPVETVGFGESCQHQIVDVVYEESGTSFAIDGETYELPMVGEFNVRNAAMAVMSALRAGVSADACRAALLSFEGIARRQEVRGEAGGRVVIDDFAHHPTAIGLAVKALKQKYPERRLWVIFEPRSNTTRRNVFQTQLAEAFSEADAVVIPAVLDPGKVAEEERLDEAKLVSDIQASGTLAWYKNTVQEIVDVVGEESAEGDVIAVLSNGGFEGIHERLLKRLAE